MGIHESLEQIMKSERLFGKMFYETFFARCPEAADHFASVDMERQALVLTMALTLIEQFYTNGYPAIAQYLQHLGTGHSDKKIPQEMYADWRDAMLASLKEFHGDNWNDTLETDWSDAIGATTNAIFQGYDHRVGM